jgi:hypothetical protein
MSSTLYISPTSVITATDWAVTGTGDKLVAITDGSDSTYLHNTSTGILKIQFPVSSTLGRPGVKIQNTYIRYRNSADEPSTVKWYLGAVTSQANPAPYAGGAAWFEEDFTSLRPGGGSWTGADFTGTWYHDYSKSSGTSCVIFECQAKVIALFPASSLCEIIQAMGLGPLLAFGVIGAHMVRSQMARTGHVADIADVLEAAKQRGRGYQPRPRGVTRLGSVPPLPAYR